jgi:hypothetical protein
MRDDPVTDAPLGDLCPDRVDDAGRVAAAHVIVEGLATTLSVGDHVDGHTSRRPDVVVVDAGRHHGDEDLTRSDRRDVHLLDLERVGGVSETLGPDDLGVHRGRHLAEGRKLTDRWDFRHGLSLSCFYMYRPT